MSTRRRLKFHCAVAVILAVHSVGCNPGHFRAETVLHSDGSVERAVYQPVEVLPKDSNPETKWETYFKKSYIPLNNWSGSIRDLKQDKSTDEKENGPYFVAWGKFDNVVALPDYYEKTNEDTAKKSQLVRDYKRTDYGFVVEHTWSETLTEIVTLNDIHLAQQELTSLFIQVLKPTLEEGLGDDYETGRLITWVQDDGSKWLGQIVDAYIESSLDNSREIQPAFEERCKAIASTHGLKSFEEDAVRQFAIETLRRTIRHKDGRPSEDEVIHAILGLFNLTGGGDDGETPKSASALALDAALTRVVDEEHGGQEEFEMELSRLIRRIQGFYGPVTHTGEFHYEMDIPGSIVSTNGILLSEQRVRWTFNLQAAYPLGYTMACRSLEPASEIQKKLIGRETLNNRKAMLSYVALVESDDTLRKTLVDCASSGSLNALFDLRTVIELGDDAQAKARLRKLWTLLQLTT